VERRMPAHASYKELVARAEQAVAGVNDPELKRIAFQKVLEDLLAGSSSTVEQPKAAPKKEPKAKQRPRRASKGGPSAYVQEMIDDGFFKKPKTIALVKAELENRGHHIPLTSLSGPLQKLCQQRRLRRQRVKTSGKKQTFAYSHW
jgi:hypothetical protein